MKGKKEEKREKEGRKEERREFRGDTWERRSLLHFRRGQEGLRDDPTFDWILEK